MSMVTSSTHHESHENQKMDEQQKQMLEKIAASIRGLSIDGVQAANSGHPGLPLGCADLGAYLYGQLLQHNPKNPEWLGRDRFILSAGHGSMFLYSCLHLAGFDLSIEELKNFRQLHSQTPGHPEYGETAGVETTTGPLGQGFATGVGQALGIKLMAERFNTKEHPLFQGKVYLLAGDGCLMEGVSAETASLAGHLKLDNLVAIFDSNDITLDGPLSESGSEDTAARFRAYGWEVYEIDGHNLDETHHIFSAIKQNQSKPVLIIAKTVIGKGSPNKQGTHKVHGAPLGPEEVALTKEALGLPAEDFYVPQSVYDYFERLNGEQQKLESAWNEMFSQWKNANPEKYAEFEAMRSRELPRDLEEKLWQLEVASPIAGRKASNTVIGLLANELPHLYGGSADLSCSDLTLMKDHGVVAPGDFSGRNIKYGVREFGMACMGSGLFQSQMITPFVGTFLTFSDYMRNAIRLAALMKVQVIYQFTHDSIFLGEDGPTHQPVEHFAALRSMPNLQVFRPGDANEVKMSWLAALKYEGPSAMIFTRQNLPEIAGTNKPFADGVGRGGYIVRQESGSCDFTLFATGSELSLAIDVADALEKHGKGVRVVSMPCWELFERQDQAYKQSVVGGQLGKRVSIEAGVEMGWHKYIGSDGVAISQETFGASAPAGVLAKEFGFTVESILERIL